MLAKRQPLLWAFAGGSVWGAALIVFWDGGTTTSSRESPIARAPEPYRAPPVAPAPKHDDSVASVEPSTPKPAEVVDAGSPAEPGSSVADVLARLEAAYREGLAATAPVNTSSSTGGALAPAAVSSPPPAPVATAAAPVATTAIAVATPPAVAAQPVVTLVSATPPKSAPASDAVPAVAPPAESGPVLASRDDARTREVHIGDVVHQGDVVQQLAILQYMQLLALPPYGQYAPPVAAPSAPRTRGPRAGVSWRSSFGSSRPVATVPYPTTLTNPDNPWGFNFPPTPLTK